MACRRKLRFAPADCARIQCPDLHPYSPHAELHRQTVVASTGSCRRHVDAGLRWRLCHRQPHRRHDRPGCQRGYARCADTPLRTGFAAVAAVPDVYTKRRARRFGHLYGLQRTGSRADFFAPARHAGFGTAGGAHCRCGRYPCWPVGWLSSSESIGQNHHGCLRHRVFSADLLDRDAAHHAVCRAPGRLAFGRSRRSRVYPWHPHVAGDLGRLGARHTTCAELVSHQHGADDTVNPRRHGRGHARRLRPLCSRTRIARASNRAAPCAAQPDDSYRHCVRAGGRIDIGICRSHRKHLQLARRRQAHHRLHIAIRPPGHGGVFGAGGDAVRVN